MEWYYAKDGKQEGPVSAAQLRQLASAGKLEPTDMVFKIGSKDWVEAATVSGLFAAGRSAPAAPAPEAGGFAFGGESEKVAAAPARRKGARERVEAPADDEDAPRSRSVGKGGGEMKDMAMFRRMTAPWSVTITFWLFVLTIVSYAGYFLIQILDNIRIMGFHAVVAMGFLLLGTATSILLVRLFCELVLIVYRIYEAVPDIKNALERQRNP